MAACLIRFCKPDQAGSHKCFSPYSFPIFLNFNYLFPSIF
jgi:hypothetical protein